MRHFFFEALPVSCLTVRVVHGALRRELVQGTGPPAGLPTLDRRAFPAVDIAVIALGADADLVAASAADEEPLALMALEAGFPNRSPPLPGAGQRGRSGRYSPRVQRPESPPRRPKCGKHMMGLFYFRRGAFYSKRGVRGSGEGRRSGFGIDRRGGVVISRPESFPCPTGRILRVFAGVHRRASPATQYDGRRA